MNRESDRDAGALRACHEAYTSHDYQRCLYLASQILASTGASARAKATAWYYRGNIDESRGNNGKALRSWASAIKALEQEGIHDSELAGLISIAIDGNLSLPRVFLSYSSADSGAVHEVRNLLESNAVSCIDYDRDFSLGREVEDEIRTAIWQSSSIFLFWSSTYQRSSYCQLELEHSLAMSKEWSSVGIRQRLTVIRLDESKLPGTLSKLIWTKFESPLSEKVKGKLIQAANAREEI